MLCLRSVPARLDPSPAYFYGHTSICGRYMRRWMRGPWATARAGPEHLHPDWNSNLDKNVSIVGQRERGRCICCREHRFRRNQADRQGPTSSGTCSSDTSARVCLCVCVRTYARACGMRARVDVCMCSHACVRGSVFVCVRGPALCQLSHWHVRSLRSPAGRRQEHRCWPHRRREFHRGRPPTQSRFTGGTNPVDFPAGCFGIASHLSRGPHCSAQLRAPPEPPTPI